MTPHFLHACVRGPANPAEPANPANPANPENPANLATPANPTSWSLWNTTTSRELAGRLLLAFDRDSRNRGLLGRDGLEPRDALVLAPCSSVHTWFMRFPIDILFVARDGSVLKVRRAVRPWRLAFGVGTFAVVEMAAGASAGTDVGHRLTVVPGRTGA